MNKFRVQHVYGDHVAWESRKVSEAEAIRVAADMAESDAIFRRRWLKGYEDADLIPPHREVWTVRVVSAT